ncbi:MAG: cupin domain-containing protein [Chloroflexota bacterium]
MVQQSTSPRVSPSEEMIQIGTLKIRFLVTRADSNGTVAVLEMTVPAGDKLAAPPHSHDAYEETIYGMEGALTWTVDGDAIAVGAGQALCIPRGAVHQFANHGSEDATALIIITPAVIGPEYFRESAEVIKAAVGGPPDRAKLMEIMRRHGLTPAPPPSA